MGFKHLRHVSKDSETGELTESISVPIKGAPSLHEVSQTPDDMLAGTSGTESTASFMQGVQVVRRPHSTIEPLSHIVSQPADISSAVQPDDREFDLPGSFTSESSLEWAEYSPVLPKPPSPVSDEEDLISQINTFDRRTLRHVKERKKIDSSTFEDPLSMQSLLRAGLDRMRGKLESFEHVGSFNTLGEEQWGDDDFDGPLFV